MTVQKLGLVRKSDSHTVNIKHAMILAPYFVLILSASCSSSSENMLRKLTGRLPVHQIQLGDLLEE